MLDTILILIKLNIFHLSVRLAPLLINQILMTLRIEFIQCKRKNHVHLYIQASLSLSRVGQLHMAVEFFIRFVQDQIHFIWCLNNA